MPALTRGPLPARVYWIRRLMVLGTALLLVVGVAHLLGGGSDASDGHGAARLAADGSPTGATDTVTTAPTPVLPTPTGPTLGPGAASVSSSPTLAVPTGACADDDVAVTPEVANAAAGRDVRIVLRLRTLDAAACTWQVTPRTLSVKITSGSDAIWSSRDCPRSIPKRDVVVRRDTTTSIAVIWPGAKRSAEDCTRFTSWAMPGWYHVTAASIGGEPSDVQFELGRPTAPTITRTAKPTQSPSGSSSPSQPRPSGRPIAPSPSKSPSKAPSKSPTKSPNGPVD